MGAIYLFGIIIAFSFHLFDKTTLTSKKGIHMLNPHIVYNSIFKVLIKCYLVIFITIVTSHSRNVTGTITGTIIDSRTKQPVTKAIVIISSSELTDTISSNGNFKFFEVPVGLYDFSIHSKNYISKISE